MRSSCSISGDGGALEFVFAFEERRLRLARG